MLEQNELSHATITYQHYDADGYYTTSTPADIHPVDREVLMNPPHNATFDEVPDPIPQYRWPKYVNQKWVLVDNYKDVTYWTPDHVAHVITKYEEAPPSNATLSDPGPSVAMVRQKKLDTFNMAYHLALNTPIPFTSEIGLPNTYQRDRASVEALSLTVASFRATETVPEGFFWKSFENIRVPFTYKDLVQLLELVGTENFKLFEKFQNFKEHVQRVTTIAEIEATQWLD